MARLSDDRWAASVDYTEFVYRVQQEGAARPERVKGGNRQRLSEILQEDEREEDDYTQFISELMNEISEGDEQDAEYGLEDDRIDGLVRTGGLEVMTEAGGGVQA